MLEYTEQRIFPADTPTVASAVPPAVYQGSLAQVAQLPPAGPMQPGVLTFLGRAQGGSWGLVPEVMVRAYPAPSGTAVELRVGAQLDQTTLILGVLLLVVFWPAAVICGVIAYQDFVGKRTAMLGGIWAQLAASAGPPQAPNFYGAQPPPGPGFSGQYG